MPSPILNENTHRRMLCLALIVQLLALPPLAASPDVELVVQQGHDGQISAVAASADGSVFASGAEQEVKIWVKDGLLRTIQRKGSGIAVALAFSRDAQSISILSVLNEFEIWSLDGRLLFFKQVDNRCCDLGGSNLAVLSPDGSRIAWIKDMPERVLRTMDSQGRVSTVAMAPLATNQWLSHGSLVFHPDGRSIFHYENGNLVQRHVDGRMLKRYGQFKGWIHPHVDESILLTATDETTLIRPGKVGARLPFTIQQIVPFESPLRFTPDGTEVAILDRNAVRFLRLDTSTERHRIELTSEVTNFTLAGESIFTAGGSDVEIRSREGTLIKRMQGAGLPGPLLPDGKMNLHGLALVSAQGLHLWSLDGTWLTTQPADNSRKILAASRTFGILKPDSIQFYGEAGNPQSRIESPDTYSADADISPDGATVASANGGGFRIHSVEGKLLLESERADETGGVSVIRFTPDGRHIVTLDSAGLRIWGKDGKRKRSVAVTEEQLRTAGENAEMRIAISDNLRIAICGQDALDVWSMEGEHLRSLASQRIPRFSGGTAGTLEACAIDAAGKTIVLAESTGRLTLLNVAAGTKIPLVGHRTMGRPLYRVWFLKDSGEFLTSTGSELIFWSAAGRLVRRLSVSGNLLGMTRSRVYMHWNANSIRIFNRVDGTLVATLLAVSNDSGVAYTPDGYYMLFGPNAPSAIAFRKKRALFRSAELETRFNRPQIVRQRIQGQPGS